jgi:NADH-quinone oxidoreductase subunit J
MNAIFYISAVVAVIATVMVITRTSAVHALLYLVVSLLAVAVIFFVLGAPFVAALEVIVYAGAIMVLFVFVVMMLNLGPQAAAVEVSWLSPRVWIGPAGLCAVLLGELVYVFAGATGPAAGGESIGPQEVGVSLFGPYVIGVELASMLLLAALVGAYHLGRRDRPPRAVAGPASAGEGRPHHLPERGVR